MNEVVKDFVSQLEHCTGNRIIDAMARAIAGMPKFEPIPLAETPADDVSEISRIQVRDKPESEIATSITATIYGVPSPAYMKACMVNNLGEVEGLRFLRMQIVPWSRQRSPLDSELIGRHPRFELRNRMPNHRMQECEKLHSEVET